MQKLKFIIALTFVAAIVFACSKPSANNNSPQFTTNQNGTTASFNTAPANENPVDELASAKNIYTEKCVKCHKEDGKGGITDFDGTKIKAPDFTSAKHHDSDADYLDVIANGAKEDGMPAFKGKISDDDIKNLVKYIRRDFQKK